MHQTHFSKIENGQRPLTFDWARRIAVQLGVTLADLLPDADHPLRLHEDERTLIERYRAASNDQRQNIQKVTEALVPYDGKDRAA